MTTVNVLNDTNDLVNEAAREIFSINKRAIDTWFDTWMRHFEDDESKEQLQRSYKMSYTSILCSYMHIHEVKWSADANTSLSISTYEKDLATRINEMTAQFTIRLAELD